MRQKFVTVALSAFSYGIWLQQDKLCLNVKQGIKHWEQNESGMREENTYSTQGSMND